MPTNQPEVSDGRPFSETPPQQSHINLIRLWLADQGQEPVLQLDGITLEDAESLEIALEKEGRRLRYSWYSGANKLCISVPCDIHELAGHWIVRECQNLEDMLKKHAVDGCVIRRLEFSGAATRLLTGTKPPSKFEPDQGIMIYDERTKSFLRKRMPIIVFETALSQSKGDALKKAEKWLWDSKFNVQAVVMYRMSWPISKDSFEASIGIWERNGEDVDVTFPLVPFNHEDLVLADPPQDLGTGYTKPDSGRSNRSIVIRGGWIKIIDESDPSSCEDAPELPFCVFDFLRVCRNHPEDYKNTVIPVPLNGLRSRTMDFLESHRRSQAEETASRPLPLPTAGRRKAPTRDPRLPAQVASAR